jgi:hypothetical protein
LNYYLSESGVINQIERKINKHKEYQSLDLLPMHVHMLAKSDFTANIFYPMTKKYKKKRKHSCVTI